VTYGYRVPDHASFDPIAEAHRQWTARWPEHADHMTAVTSVMRVQQLLLARVEDILKPYGLTFALYEALRLLAFSRSGSLPMGKMGVRLMVHPAAVTNAIGKLEQRGLVHRSMSPDDRRVVLASITPAGRELADQATGALNEAEFGLPGLTAGQAAELTDALRAIRALVGDTGLGGTRPGELPLPAGTAPGGWLTTIPAGYEEATLVHLRRPPRYPRCLAAQQPHLLWINGLVARRIHMRFYR
jgi:DNA-binding MarR family transcriptional regulator